MNSVNLDDELLDLVDERDTIIGQKRRSDVYREGLSNFRFINAFLANSKGQIWIPQIFHLQPRPLPKN
jgi:isopentenyl-diphosphate delta-isomerase